MTRRVVVLFVLVLSWMIIDGSRAEPSHSANVYAIATAPESAQQRNAAASKLTWEYRILLGNVSQLASLESSINALAEQDYAVESFQPVPLVSGGFESGVGAAFGLNSTTQVFVLLKRIRK